MVDVVAIDPTTIGQTACPHQSHHLATFTKSSGLTLRIPCSSEGYVGNFTPFTILAVACTITASSITIAIAVGRHFLD